MSTQQQLIEYTDEDGNEVSVYMDVPVYPEVPVHVTFPCTVQGCGYSANLKSNLTHHMACAHGLPRVYVCEIEGCTYKSNYKTNLSNHQARVHDIRT